MTSLLGFVLAAQLMTMVDCVIEGDDRRSLPPSSDINGQ